VGKLSSELKSLTHTAFPTVDDFGQESCSLHGEITSLTGAKFFRTFLNFEKIVTFNAHLKDLAFTPAATP
jgi:hypothetical protein